MKKTEILKFLDDNQSLLPVLTSFWEINTFQIEKKTILCISSAYYNDFECKLKPHYKPIAKIISPDSLESYEQNK